MQPFFVMQLHLQFLNRFGVGGKKTALSVQPPWSKVLSFWLGEASELGYRGSASYLPGLESLSCLTCRSDKDLLSQGTGNREQRWLGLPSSLALEGNQREEDNTRQPSSTEVRGP